jgi:hypothetical protein
VPLINNHRRRDARIGLMDEVPSRVILHSGGNGFAGDHRRNLPVAGETDNFERVREPGSRRWRWPGRRRRRPHLVRPR